MYNAHVCHDCRRIQHTPSLSVEIMLPVHMFVLFGYPLRGGRYRQPFPKHDCVSGYFEKITRRERVMRVSRLKNQFMDFAFEHNE